MSSEQITNQGRKERLVANSPTEDGLFFGSLAELQAYRCLRDIQAKSREEQTFAVFPLAGGRLRSGHTWTPDFLVVGNGRAVIFEVDGPHHRQQRRYADDKSRDLYWTRCGVQVVRIHAEDTRGDKELTGRLHEELRRWLLR